jgi:hypothetical protein
MAMADKRYSVKESHTRHSAGILTSLLGTCEKQKSIAKSNKKNIFACVKKY